MFKIELAKMMGLTSFCGDQLLDLWHIEKVLKQDWYLTHEVEFNAGIIVTITHEDFHKDKLDIKLEDLDDELDAKCCIKQVEGLIWERAADEYLNKIKTLVENIKV
jgi:hypothetical protein